MYGGFHTSVPFYAIPADACWTITFLYFILPSCCLQNGVSLLWLICMSLWHIQSLNIYLSYYILVALCLQFWVDFLWNIHIFLWDINQFTNTNILHVFFTALYSEFCKSVFWICIFCWDVSRFTCIVPLLWHCLQPWVDVLLFIWISLGNWTHHLHFPWCSLPQHCGHRSVGFLLPIWFFDWDVIWLLYFLFFYPSWLCFKPWVDFFQPSTSSSQISADELFFHCVIRLWHCFQPRVCLFLLSTSSSKWSAD